MPYARLGTQPAAARSVAFFMTCSNARSFVRWVMPGGSMGRSGGRLCGRTLSVSVVACNPVFESS